MVYSNKHFIKHVPVADRAALLHERLAEGEHRQASDYVGYEKFFTLLTYSIEMELYRFMMQNLPQGKWKIEFLERLLKGLNKCKFKFLTAMIPSSRMSGEMNTSLGNGFVNLMLFLFNNWRRGNRSVDCFVEGDDLIGVYSGVKLTPLDYLECGFVIKLIDCFNVNEASFCGLIYDKDDLVSIADPLKIILNIGWVSARYINSSEKCRKELLRAKAMSLQCQYPGTPIIQSLAQWLLRVTAGEKFRIPGEWTNWQRKTFKGRFDAAPIGMGTRHLMEKVFGFTYFEQMELEKYFDSRTKIEPIDHFVLWDKYSADQVTYAKVYVTDPAINKDRPYLSVLSTDRKSVV